MATLFVSPSDKKDAFHEPLKTQIGNHPQINLFRLNTKNTKLLFNGPAEDLQYKTLIFLKLRQSADPNFPKSAKSTAPILLNCRSLIEVKLSTDQFRLL